MKRFTIRPKIRPEESLTSFLLRVCTSNSINIKDLFNVMKINYKRPDLRNSHQIDINPVNTIDVNLLMELTNIDQSILNKNTFYGVINKFISQDEMRNVNSSSALFKDLFSMKKRKFCPLCLEERLTYKLIWQVKDILTCSKHEIPLSSSCLICGKEQPYLHMGLAKGICCFCSSSLSTIEIIEFDNDSLIYSNWLIENWDNLTSLNDSLLTNNDKHIAEKLLFVLGNKNECFSLHSGDQLNRDYKFKLLRILRNNSSEVYGVGLNILLKLLWKLNYTIKEFFSMEIPTEFQNSLKDYLYKKSFIKCISPWCNHNGTSEKLIKIKSFRAKTHHSLHICLGCCVKFGVNKKGKIWEEYGDLISLGYKTILPMLNKGENIFSISKKTSISRYKIYKMTSYFARFNLINSNYIEEFIPDEKYLLSNDEIIRIADSNETKMRGAAMQNYNLGISNFYYFYYENSVQEYLFNG